MLKIIVATLTLLVSIPIGAADRAADPQVEMKTSLGTIVLELYPDKAPLTVENFLQYVKAGHYDGTLFHRVIPGFMIQGGGFTPDFKQKATRSPVRNEAANGLKNVSDNVPLDFRFPTPEGYGYTVFGKVVKGMDAVNRIVNVETGPGPAGHRDVPIKPVTIESAKVLEAAAKPANK
jgi:peptidyl-prolyl cis-trans isomerase B (cyclophilin B)